MLAFINLSPGVFPLPQNTKLKCANVSCEKQTLFCETVVWYWHDVKPNNAGFCGHQCALDAMNTVAMASA